MSPQLGDFFVVRTNGLAAWGIRLVTGSTVNHAGIYVGDDRIVEANPGGADLSPVSYYPEAIWASYPLTDRQREDIALGARAVIGTPYSWTDCAAIGLAKLFGRALPAFVRRRLSRPDRLMCSQLVDEVYLEAGVHLFDDGRLPGDVSPGDLYDLLKETP